MESPLELKNKELVAKNAELVTQIGIHSNVENTYKLKVEDIKRELAAIEETKEQKLGELSAAQTDLDNTLKSAAESKAQSLAEADKARGEVTDLTEKISSLKGEVAAIEKKIEEARELLKTESQAIDVLMATHEAFMAKATSEKTRILSELKQLDDTAKAQVVVIEAQSNAQTSLDEQISSKRGVIVELDTDIEAKTEKVSTVTVELQNLEETHKNRMKTTGEEFSTFMDETTKAKTKASEELAIVEADLEAKNAQAVAWVGREEELKQREQFIKERYAKAGIAW